MDKSVKRIVFPLVILAVLIAAVLFAANPFTQEKKEQEKLATDTALLTFCDFGAGVISRIEVDPPGEEEPFHFAKEGEDWFVAQGDSRFHTNDTKIENLLDAVAGLRSTNIATDKQAEHANYELADDTAYGLKVYTGGDSAVADLLIGKSAAGTNFARLPGENEVYRLNNNVKIEIGFAFRDYRSKTPWGFDPQRVEGVHLRQMPDPDAETWPANSDEAAVIVNKVNGLWQAQDGRGVDQNTLTEAIDRLSRLTVNGFADDVSVEDAGLIDMEPHVTVVSPLGELSLTFGKLNDGSQFYVQDHDGLRYNISKYNVNFLTDLKNLEGLFFKPVDETEHEANENIAEDLPTDTQEE